MTPLNDMENKMSETHIQAVPDTATNEPVTVQQVIAWLDYWTGMTPPATGRSMATAQVMLHDVPEDVASEVIAHRKVLTADVRTALKDATYYALTFCEHPRVVVVTTQRAAKRDALAELVERRAA